MFSALFITFGYHISSIRCDGYHFLFAVHFLVRLLFEGGVDFTWKPVDSNNG